MGDQLRSAQGFGNVNVSSDPSSGPASRAVVGRPHLNQTPPDVDRSLWQTVRSQMLDLAYS